MKIRTSAALFLTAGVAACLPTVAMAVNFPEIEPNETKAQALTNGAFTLVAGDTLTGTTTGTSTTVAGAASADTYLVKTSPLPLGSIYRHRLAITTAGGVGHTGSIRGLASTATGAIAGGDSTFQSSTTSTFSVPIRMNQWYGFGKEEQLYYRVTGAVGTTTAYVSTLSTTTITPSVQAGSIEAGTITIDKGIASPVTDKDMILFDSNFNPIAGIDDPDTQALSVNLAAGTYYFALGRFSTAAGPFAGNTNIQGSFQAGTVLDFADAVATSSTFNLTLPSVIAITSGAGPTTATAPALTPYDVAWFVLTVGPAVTPTNPTATDIATPATVVRDGVATTTLSVTVAPGQIPISTFANVGSGVVVNASSVGGSGTLVLLDDGIGADLLAGDLIYTATTTVARTTVLGTATLPYTVTDDQARNGGAALSLNFTVAEASGACCVADVCTISTINNCIDVLLGTFAGTGTQCFAPPAFTTDGAAAFENIAGTGTVLAAVTGDDVIGTVAIPFAFNFYGTAYTSANVSTNGNIQFPASNSTAFTNGPIPSAAIPNNALYVLWDDLNVTAGGQVFTQQLGTIGTDARFIIQWNIVPQFVATDASTFQIALFEDGNFEFRYLSVSAESVVGDTTTIGFEDGTGIVASTLAETRASLSALAPISYRANSTVSDTGVCSACPACPADYNQDGGVTGDDIAAFFADFETGGGCADTNVDGGITGDDIAAFFTAFEAGGC